VLGRVVFIGVGWPELDGAGLAQMSVTEPSAGG
jgi:hypothetical protein